MFKIKKLEKFAVIESLQSEIELKDLTIFMGDNSAGKSYLAMLIHSFVTMTKGYSDDDFLKAIVSKFKNTSLIKKLDDVLKLMISNESDNILFSMSDNQIIELKEIIEFSINDYLIKKYLTKTLFEEHNLKKIEIELNNLQKLIPKMISLKTLEKDNTKTIEAIIEEKHKIGSSFQIDTPIEIIYDFVSKNLISGLIELSIKKTLPNNSAYLPASRTGYLQTYKALSSDAIMSNFSNKNEERHTLSIIIRFFITQLNTATNFDESNQFAKFIENFILNGKVDIYKDSNEIDFKLNDGTKINLNYLSSTVSELIPLVVFLKRGIIRKGGLVVIEEPEAHLSFNNQKLLAKLIVLLVDNNIKTLITTHSDFLIYEINNLIMKHSIIKKSKKDYKEFAFLDNISLDHKKVSLYNFILNDEKKSNISRVKISNYGIENKYIFDNTYNITKEKNDLYDLMDSLDA